eukprot:14196997-Alexandrium_andersonii.AAC.1
MSWPALANLEVLVLVTMNTSAMLYVIRYLATPTIMLNVRMGVRAPHLRAPDAAIVARCRSAPGRRRAPYRHTTIPPHPKTG